MFREDVLRGLRDEYEDDGRIFPAYGSYCFASVPGTIRSVFDAGGRRSLPDDVFTGVDTDAERVVAVVVDGYGLDSWRRDREAVPFLDRLTERGTVTPLTSCFPSETAAAMTTFETGDLPCEHGRVGWNVYEPETDRTFLAFTGEVKSGDEEGAVADEAFDGVDYHYEDLAAAGIDCHKLEPFEVAIPGVTERVYDGLDGLGERLADVTTRSDAPAYVHAYLDHVDRVSHHEGTESDAFRETVATVCGELSAFVDGLDDEVARETLLLVTADHGHVNTDPERNVDLSGRERLMEALRRHADGTPIRMSGSPRNVHLHLRDGAVPEVREALSDLDVTAFTRDEALDRGLFGDREPSDRFRRRCGDLVVTHRDLGTWFGDVEADELDLVGMHGGLHPEEMLVPFAAVRADRLR
ncbi:alkaline phosphatase family protein [Halomicrobium salinisoli]|uniref:alkaline phosphatase family protein n=1 Tax=Halomicrobium salinisoli TaxID=2878391 RepID=UPI001CEFB5C9|nr:alkaline phosphatase family protein [Halomicrobium salinisoli]